jgi:hypothetical protein
MAYYLSLLQVHQAHAKQDALNEGHHQWHRHQQHSKQIFCHHHHCLQYDCYQSVTLKAGMFLTTYYLSLLQLHQAHAEQDAPNAGHHQLHCHHHRAKQIFWCHSHCLQYDCYQNVTLKAGMFLMTYYLSLLQVHQVHAEQDPQTTGITSGNVIIIAQNKSCRAAAIASRTIPTMV